MGFIETSALDASNVDTAFENILKECYQVVSSKQPENAGGKEEGSPSPSSGTKINIEAPKTSSKKNGCC